jgi:hypothetical protein
VRPEGYPRYVPERWWRVMNVSVFGSLSVFRIIVFVLAAGEGDTGGMVMIGCMTVLALIAVMRTMYVGVICTEDTLIVRGSLWSRRIPRAAIMEVDTEPHDMFLIWKGRSGIWRFTPLTMMWGGDSGWMPKGSRRERQWFLAKLARWAERGRPS